MKKLKSTQLNLILALGGLVVLLALVALLINQIVARRSADEASAREQLVPIATLALAVAGDNSPCRPLQAIYSSADDEVFDQYYSNCSAVLAELAAASRPALDSTIAVQLYANIDQVLSLSDTELARYQSFRSQHALIQLTPAVSSSIESTESTAEPSESTESTESTESPESTTESAESSDSSAILLYEALNALRNSASSLVSDE